MKPASSLLHLLLLIVTVFNTGKVGARERNGDGEYRWSFARSGKYSYKYVTGDPTKTRFYTLNNGLTVILSPTHKEPRMQVYIAVKAGSKTDPATHTGLAHYLEHMMFKGTSKYGSNDWRQEKPLLDKIDDLYELYNKTTNEDSRKVIYHKIDSVSGLAAKCAIANEYDKMMGAIGVKGTNAFTSFEQTVYTEDVPANAADKFFEVQAERFRDPVFRIFHTELEAVYEEKNRGIDNDFSKAYELLLAELFKKHNYGKQTTIGTIEHLKNPSLVEIRNYYNKYYVPNNMGIIVAGDFEPDELIKKIDRYFSYMRKKDVPKYEFEPEDTIAVPIEKTVYGSDAEFVMTGYRMPGVHEKGALLADLVSQVLTNGRAGLIDLNLVKGQKVLRAYAGVDVLIDYGYMYMLGYPTTGQSLKEVQTLMHGEIEKLKQGKFDDDLLVSIVNNAKKEKMQDNEKYGSRASSLMGVFTSEDDWRDYAAYTDRLSALTKQDIVDFANKYFGDNYVVVYKKKGEDKNLVKVEKPPITPIDPNRNKQSPFVKKIVSMPQADIKPVWVDYNKDIHKSYLGPAEVLHVQNDENDLFRMAYRYRTGTRNDRRIELAAEYLQFLGEGGKSAEDISKEFYKLACSFRVIADDDYTTVYLEGLQENFGKATALLERLLANCKPDDEALAALKERIRKSRADAKNNKNAIMQGLVYYARYGAKNPFNDVFSDSELEAIKSEELTDLLHGLSSTSHRILYYGPLSVTNLTASLKPIHELPAMFKPAPAPTVYKYVIQSANEVLFADYDMVQSEVRWVRNVPGYDPIKQPAVEMFNNYFGGNMGALVFQTIRESKALAYSTNAYISTPKKREDPYMVSAYVGCQADKFKESVVAMNELLNDLPYVENSLAASVSGIKKELETERITQDKIIYDYLDAEQKGLKTDIRRSIYARLDKTDYSALKKLHSQFMASKPYTYCVVASKDKINMDDVKACGAVRKLSLEEIFGY